MQGSIRQSRSHDDSLLRVFERYSVQCWSLRENSDNLCTEVLRSLQRDLYKVNLVTGRVHENDDAWISGPDLSELRERGVGGNALQVSRK